MGAVLTEPALVRICDLAGRPRGTGFLADELGTVVTSHEAVDGLGRVVLSTAGERSHLAETADITPLPEWDLALIRTEGLGLDPLVIAAERAEPAGTAVRLRTGHSSPRRAGWTDARLAGTATVTYTSTDRFHALEDVLELALSEAAAVELRLSRRASGSPVLDAASGAVLAVLGTALHVPGRSAGFAVPLRAAGRWEPDGPLGALIARNGATVAGFGPDLNLAGALRLTAASVRPAVERARSVRRVHRPEVSDALRRFLDSDASTAALVGPPGSGRTTELSALAERRAEEATPAPTVWLRGADLRAGDGSLRDAVGRALTEADGVVAGAGAYGRSATGEDGRGDGAADGGEDRGADGGEDGGEDRGEYGAPRADVVARLARDAKRPLLVLLDGPEEMPEPLARELRRWTAGTASWLRASGARMVIACGPEHWEQAGELYPSAILHDGLGETSTHSGTVLPPCVLMGDLSSAQAVRARERYGLEEGALAEADAAHPLTVRMLGDLRAELGGGAVHGSAPPCRYEIFSAHLDLAALRIARTVAAAQGRTARGTAVRRLAALAAGGLHEAARSALARGQGAVDPAGFEDAFPRRGGWASAVLTEGVLEPAGGEYRFADEEFGQWLQGQHLDVDAAVASLLGAPAGAAAGVPGPGGRAQGAVTAPPVPRHRIGPVVQALLMCERVDGTDALERRLRPPVDACFGADAESAWWAAHLLGETLLRVADAGPYTGVLHALAERIAALGDAGGFGPWFWRRLALPTAERTELLRVLLPADPPHGADGARRNERCLNVVDELMAAEPATVAPLLCGWFTDRRPLRGPARTEGDQRAEGVPQPTVAAAAQALLYAHRGRATDALLDLLTDACHPRADELLAELAQDEPAAMCRAVERWAGDERSLRRTAAAEYGLLMARHARTDADRAHLESAARALLGSRPGEPEEPTHAPALALLLRISADPEPHLDASVDLLAATGDPQLADALTGLLRDRPGPVLAAFRTRLCEPGSGAHHLVEALGAVREAELARPTAELVREYAELRPERAGEALGAFVRCRLTHGTQGRAGLQPLTDALVCTPHASVRASLARTLGAAESGPVRDELLDVLLVGERDLTVLDAGLEAVVTGCGRAGAGEGEGQGAGELVRRIGAQMARTSEGAAYFDRRLVELAREVPGFAESLRTWTTAAPEAWSAVAGPGTRRVCEAARGQA